MAGPPEKTLRTVSRFITTHNAEGVTTFETGVPEEIDWVRLAIGGDLALPYTGTAFPVPLTGEKDLDTYKGHLVQPPPTFVIPGGFLARYVDYHPNKGDELVWHRTVTQDIGVVIEGEVELHLESGEVRLLKQGDVIVQRGTNHAWRNPSKTNFARAFYVMIAAEPVVVNGKELGENLGKIAE